MIYLVFAVGMIAVSTVIYLGYAVTNKDSWWMVAVGALMGTISSASWVTLSKLLADPYKVFLYGFYWDAVVLFSVLLIPLFLFNVRPSVNAWIGVALVTIGVFITKIE